MRHILLILLTAQYLEFNPTPALIAVMLLNTVSMLWPFTMRYMIRALTKSALAIGGVNITLVVAWLVPFSAPALAFCFIAPYLYSFVPQEGWARRVED
jgi:hypothetical protein